MRAGKPARKLLTGSGGADVLRQLKKQDVTLMNISAELNNFRADREVLHLVHGRSIPILTHSHPFVLRSRRSEPRPRTPAPNYPHRGLKGAPQPGPETRAIVASNESALSDPSERRSRPGCDRASHSEPRLMASDLLRAQCAGLGLFSLRHRAGSKGSMQDGDVGKHSSGKK